MAKEETAEVAAERVAGEWRKYWDTCARPARCIRCDHDRISWDGSRTRTASVEVTDGTAHVPEVRCRRVKCNRCGQSWTLRPPGLCAHKHYQLCVVAKATSEYLLEPGSTLTGVARRIGCDRRTVGRWVRWVAEIAEPAVVMQKVVEAVEAPVVMATPSRTGAVAQLASKARSAIGRYLFTRATEVLAAMEALASAWRLEPPGLRAVIERVTDSSNRAGVATYRRPRIPELARSPPA